MKPATMDIEEAIVRAARDLGWSRAKARREICRAIMSGEIRAFYGCDDTQIDPADFDGLMPEDGS